ncbi:MAG TPA: hypothetical protein DCM59_06130 [Clostridium sp.]|nr:hypothetical protein [Clostridium sp.]
MNNYYGKNICFYYYGEDHLVINLYRYIKQQIENNNYVYLYVDEEIYKLLINNLDINERTMIENLDISNVLMSSYDEALNSKRISKFLREFKAKASDLGFWGANFILDSVKILNNTCNTIFQEFTKTLSSLCEKEHIDVLTCYDFLDYVNKGKIITEDIMKFSYKYHDYRMFGNEILPIESFQIEGNIV